MSVYDAILASAIEGLKKKPVLIVHLLLSIAFGALILWFSKLFVRKVLGCSIYSPNFDLLLILTLTTASILIGYYVSFWHSLQERIREGVPSVFDEILGNYTSFIETLMDKTIYDFIRGQMKGISISRVGILVSSYYFMWITGLYTADLTLYIVSNHRYTLFGYMLDDAYLGLATFLASFALTQLIRPWIKSDEKRSQSPDKAIANIQYLESFLERFTSFKGLGQAWRYSKTMWGRIIINFFENFFTLPAPMRFGRLFVFDVFQTPYLKSRGSQNAVKDLPADVIERMLKKDPTENYWLEPFEERCKEAPKVKTPSLRGACWYKVRRRKDGKWVDIGYAMLLVVTKQSEERKFIKEHFNECMRTLRKQLRGGKQYCYDVMRELGKMYLKDMDIAIILLFGNEELLGLKLLLT
jgi:hypothetical protein